MSTEIIVMGETYKFPEIKDGSFLQHQEKIQETKALIEKGSREKKYLFGLIQRGPAMGYEERLELMEDLVTHYDDFVDTLSVKIGFCRQSFLGVGEGVKALFAKKADELEGMEMRRIELIREANEKGQPEVAAGLEGQGERNKALAVNLARASLLIIKKLKHALNALEILVDDEKTQREVIGSLRGQTDLFRKVYKYYRDMDRIQSDIEEITETALNFDEILKDNLGPLTILIDEISKVDSRVTESLTEIQKLSHQLELDQTIDTDSFAMNDALLNLFVSKKIKDNELNSLVASLSDTPEDLTPIDFDLDYAAGEAIDFTALTENMNALVERGMEDLTAPVKPQTSPDTPNPANPSQGEALSPEEHTPAAEGPPPEGPDAGEDYSSSKYPARGTVHQEKSTTKTKTPPAEEAPLPKESKGNAEAPPAEEASSEEKASAAEDKAEKAEKKIDQPVKTQGNYSAAISRKHPTLILFLLDQSTSMNEKFTPDKTKAEYLAETVNRTLEELSVRCAKPEGIRDYFHIACLGFRDRKVVDLFSDIPRPGSGKEEWVPISVLAHHARETVQGEDGMPHPVWITPWDDGNTPFRAAMERACEITAAWCESHLESYPPTVITVTDGISTDGDPSEKADYLKKFHTRDGKALLFNLHIDENSEKEIVFPNSPEGLDNHGALLYEMSSPFPQHLLEQAPAVGFYPEEGARFFAYSAGAEITAKFFNLGTRSSRMT